VGESAISTVFFLMNHVVQKDISNELPTIRIDDDNSIDVALSQEEFDRRIREVLQDNFDEELHQPIDRIIYWRIELPKKNIWLGRFYFALAVLAGLIFLHGFWSLVGKGLRVIMHQ